MLQLINNMYECVINIIRRLRLVRARIGRKTRRSFAHATLF